MRRKFAPYLTMLAVVTLLATVGCSNSSEDDSPGSTATGGADPVEPATTVESSVMLPFAGGTFISADEMQVGENASGDIALGHWTVEFDSDTVSWANLGVVQVGTYAQDVTTSVGMIADFSGQQIPFSLSGVDLIWDSRTYLRTSTSIGDSAESLVSYLDNSTFSSVEEFDIGENATGELVMGTWSLSFEGIEVSWRVQDAVMPGNYAYTSPARFQLIFGDTRVPAYILDGGELMVDFVIYDKSLASQFSSQESLVAFLDGKSYESLELKPIGEPMPDVTQLGYWYVNFLEDTFTWTYQDISEAGTYIYLDDDSLTAVLPDREISVVVEGDEILFDGVRYRQVM